ncbi:MAG TPA: efflux RND transporter periplasmic adaptor subunit [Treponemataceae bacterium]|nr:efflux RND transporter periplasmic adaptor subunit [Treponemataceae bacterium]
MNAPMRATKRLLTAIVFLAIVLAVFSGCAKKAGGTGKPVYEFAAVTRGSIEKSVSSSGKLEPVSSVSVLAQMSGIAERVSADYNDHVKKGQVLIELNTDMLKLDEEKQRAAVTKARATLDLDSLNYANQLKLAEKGLISDYEVKQAKTTLDVAQAEYVSENAALKVIQTEINQYAFIKSPITGVVLSRSVDVGQSVVEGSSSNASSLFTIAEDLTKMEIEATVDEVDIASISKGQEVRFTVEALPGKTFAGKVETIHLVPTTTDNVVTYTVIIEVENADGTLLPGMTADVEFIVSKSENALLVPNAALRYEPSTLTAEEIANKIFEAELSLLSPDERAKAIAAKDKKGAAPAAGQKKATSLASLMMGGGPRGPGGFNRGGASSRNGARSQAGIGAGANGQAAAKAEIKNVWYLDDRGALAVMKVSAGVTDGTNTEVIPSGELEGKKIIVKEKVN